MLTWNQVCNKITKMFSLKSCTNLAHGWQRLRYKTKTHQEMR